MNSQCGELSFLLFGQSVQWLSRIQLFATPWTTACQSSLSIANSRRLLKFMSISRWCHPAISSSVIPFSSHLQSFPASGSFPMSWLLVSGGQSIGASASVLPVSIQDCFPFKLTRLTSSLSNRLLGVFSSTTVWRHQFFDALLPLESSSHNGIWLLGRT